MTIPLEHLGRLIVAKRGNRGVRAAAAEVGVSSATLSRVENGQMPDLLTFKKICEWLDRDPAEFLGLRDRADDESPPVVHFRKKKTVSQETAKSLAELILSTQRAMQARTRLLEE